MKPWRNFGVKRSTLHKRTKNPYPNQVGRPAVFTPHEEEAFATLLLGMESMRMSLTRKMFLKIVAEDAQRKCKKNNVLRDLLFKSSAEFCYWFVFNAVITAKINRDWLRGFLERHPDLSVRKAHPKKVEDDKKFDQDAAHRFVSDLEKLRQRGYFDNPSRIINLDETGFMLGCDNSVVIVSKGGKKKYRYVKGESVQWMPFWICNKRISTVLILLKIFSLSKNSAEI